MLFSNMLGKSIKNTLLRGSAELWTPAALGAALQMWFDVSDVNSITKNGSNGVSAIANKGSLGGSSTTSAGTPQYNPDVAGLPAITGSGDPNGDASIGSLMTFSNAGLVTGGAARSLLFIGAGQSGLMMGQGTNTTAGGYSIDSPTTNARWNAGGTVVNGTVTTSSSRTVAYMHEWLYDGAGTSSMFVNGSTDITLSRTLNTANTTFNMLGWSAIPSYKQLGMFRAAMLISGQLSTLDRQKLEGWAARQYGITLPSDHPYFSAAPTL